MGFPLNLYYITPDTVKNYKKSDDLYSILTKGSLWYIPVKFNGIAKAMVIIDKMNGIWKAVSFGHAPLAREIDKILSKWRDKEGETPILAVNYQSKSYFFAIPGKNKYNLTKIKFKKITKNKYHILNDLDTVMNSIMEVNLEVIKNKNNRPDN